MIPLYVIPFRVHSSQFDCISIKKLMHFRAVLFQLFPKTVNLPPKPVGVPVTFIQ